MPRISQLPSLTSPDAADEIAIVDASAATTKKITRNDFLKGAALPADTVTTAAIADGAVTADKLDWPSFLSSSVFTVDSDILIQTGWGFITGTGSSTASSSITFPTAYSGAPHLSTAMLGFKSGSNPTAISDFSSNVAAFSTATPSTDGSGATVHVISRDASQNLATGVRYGYSWIAIGKRD